MPGSEHAPRRHPVVAWLRGLSAMSDPFFAIVALNVLHRFDLAGHGPSIWLLNGVLLLSALCQYPSVDRRLRGDGSPRPVVVWRVAAVGVALTAASTYLTGWGPLLGIAFVLLSATALQHSGSRIWRPVLILSVVAIALGQAGVAAGWIHTYLPASTAQPIGVLGTVGVAITIRILGTATAERERAQQAQRDSEATTRRNEERFRALVQDSGDVVVLSDATGAFTYVSAAVEHVMGYRPEEYLNLPATELLHPDDRPAATALHEKILGGQRDWRAELRCRHADGTWHWHEIVARNLLDNPSVNGIVFSHRDITERKLLQDRLAHDASHDALTGLANRGSLLAALTEVCSGTRPGGGRLGAVLFLDLDGFKRINDELGHEAGDQLLQAVGQVLRECVLGADTVGRLGGDEFAVVLHDIHDADNAVGVAARIIQQLARPVQVGAHAILARASIGIAMCIPGSIDTTEALHRADVAMYRAKRDAGTGWQLYVEGMQDHRSEAAALEDDLRHALLDGDGIHVFYQPVVDLETTTVIGMEALVRWHHPSRGWLSPAAFIPLAEETGLIRPLGALVLQRACAQLHRWQQRRPGGPRLTLNVNLSPRQLQHQTLVTEIRDVLRDTGTDPHDLVLELTESALVDDASVVPRLGALRDLGIRIALDDFGTGYSSLRYLIALPVDILKIDRCFVELLDGTAGNAAVVEAVIRLGEVLALGVVAEGVETAAQAAELRLRGCGVAQGFYFARPMDTAAMDALIDRRTALIA